ncbi:MAG TPA: ATP-dependent sacrificial sulfur transferase LarE [Acidimicrobiales bacterium]|nr:ATP-dependent sacrificial sulfur transferase LarE [Acidimicrobiales bacterium]
MGDIDALRHRLREIAPVVVAFSGGADSALLAWVAHTELGPDGALIATAVSASLAPSELADCRALATEWGVNYREVTTHEGDRPGYVANGPDRCWHCKDELMRCIAPIAASFGGDSAGTGASVALGVNVDDLGDYRPGQAAARDAGAVFPLVDAGFSKSDVREVSRTLGLRTWDKPAAACLASRVPYGSPVSLGTLNKVSVAEAGLRALGFREIRVRHYGDLARVELPLADLSRALAQREDVVATVRAAGYRYVTLDLEGLRSGNLNGALGELAARRTLDREAAHHETRSGQVTA